MKKARIMKLFLFAILTVSLAGCVWLPKLPWIEVLAVEGEASALVVYDRPFESRTGMFCDKNDHSQQLTATAVSHSNLLSVFLVEGTNDYYVTGTVATYENEIEIEDDLGTDFHVDLYYKSDSPEKKNVFCVDAYLKGYAEPYSLMLNGERMDFGPSPGWGMKREGD